MGIMLNRPKIMRGAFVEYGISIPPLIIPFQFNPLQVSRNRSITHSYPTGKQTEEDEQSSLESDEKLKDKKSSGGISVQKFHQAEEDLDKIQRGQTVKVDEEAINIELRLDATDRSTLSDPANIDAGIAPQLAALEKMVLPKEEGFFASLLPSAGYSFLKKPNPPMILFVWSAQRILPVNISGLNITETEFNMLLMPIRATVSVSMKVIEGKNPIYTYNKLVRDINVARHLLNVAASVVDIDIP